jgi:uncharacterized Zn-binding protein involved in type VI secretion
MPAVQRVGDSDSGGGVIIGGVPTVFVNNRPISVNGDPVTGHFPFGIVHGSPCTMQQQNSTVFANNILVVITGDADTCGHSRLNGSPDVFIG